MTKLTRGLCVLALGTAIWFFPVPAGLKPEAWHLFAIFVTTIAGFIAQPIPIGAVAFMAITFSMMTSTLKPGQALSGFSNSTIWLIVAAFLLAAGFIKTGLGRRIAYYFIHKFGDSTLKLGYVFAVCELIFGPATPSTTARAGGIIYPIVSSLANAYDSKPDSSPRRIGSYLYFTEYQLNCISSAMFLTGMTGNPIIADMAAKVLNVHISWGLWALAALVPGLLSMLVIPYFIYKIYPPEITHTPEAKELADNELKKMGPTSKAEKILSGIFIMALVLWSTSSYTKLDATAVALFAVSLMLCANIVNWDDVISNKGAWDTFFWMGTLMGLASALVSLGFIAWFSKSVSVHLAGVPTFQAFAMILVIYMYSHYGFASMVAHIVALYSALGSLAIASGVPPYLAALSLAYISSLCGSLTHYGGGPAPIYFAAGYVPQNTWWKMGFYLSLVNSVIWIGIGSFWWKILGLW